MLSLTVVRRGRSYAPQCIVDSFSGVSKDAIYRIYGSGQFPRVHSECANA